MKNAIVLLSYSKKKFLVTLLFNLSFQKVGVNTKDINIRFKTKTELSHSDRFPFIITIDGIEQENIKRFSIDINAENENIETNTYTIEKYMDYPRDEIT